MTIAAQTCAETPEKSGTVETMRELQKSESCWRRVAGSTERMMFSSKPGEVRGAEKVNGA
eukprot:541917-Prymnesium_polylepis.1